MLTLALIAAFCIWLVVSSYAGKGIEAQQEANRMLWLERWALVILALCAPNPWIAGLMVLPLLTIGTQGKLNRNQQEPLLMTCILWSGLYVALAPHVTLAWVPWLLGAILFVGFLQGLYAIHSLIVIERPHEKVYNILGYKLMLWEPRAEIGQLCVGLGNPNHPQAVSGMATAAGIGLMLMGYWAVIPFVALSAIVLVVAIIQGDCSPRKEPVAAHGYALVLILTLFFVFFPVGGIVAGMLAVAAGGWLIYLQPYILSERLMIWTWLWKQTLNRSILEHAVGIGTGSWIRSQMLPEPTRPFKSLVVQPHNDFLLLLFEHGWVGIAVLMGYLGTSVWQAWQAGPAGAAVLLLGAVIVACACVSSPWHPYVEVTTINADRTGFAIVGQGCPAINVMSFAAVLCVEALRL